jgi:DNA polymerase III epsilon subunit family exonuclease
MEQKINWEHSKQLPDINNRIIVFDTETSGLSHFHEQILELAAVEILNGKISGKQFHIFLKPIKPIKKEITDINHIKTDDYENYFEEYFLEEKNLIQSFLDFIGNDSIIFAHNMTFDFYFLNDELEKLGFQKLPPERFRCSMKVFNELMKTNFPELKVKKKLIDCCNYFNIKPYSLDGLFHNGLFDTIMTAKLICKLYEFNQGKFKKDDLLKNINNYQKNNLEIEDNKIKENKSENLNIKKKYNENIINNESIINQNTKSDIVNNIFSIPYYTEKNNKTNDLKDIAKKLSMLSFCEK